MSGCWFTTLEMQFLFATLTPAALTIHSACEFCMCCGSGHSWACPTACWSHRSCHWGEIKFCKLHEASCEKEHFLAEASLATALSALLTLAGSPVESQNQVMSSASGGPEQGQYARWIKLVWLPGDGFSQYSCPNTTVLKTWEASVLEVPL